MTLGAVLIVTVAMWWPHSSASAQADDQDTTGTATAVTAAAQVDAVTLEPPPAPRYTSDPWADAVLRWPDPLSESQLGTEPTYYWFARDDRRSLLPAATEERPLLVWAGGDSMSGGPVYGFRQLIADHPDFGFTEEIIKSTGVVTDWYFDWVEYMADTVAEGPYDVIVLAMGANDRQRFRGLGVPAGDPEWLQRYQARVRDLVAAAVRPGRLVIWVGLPPLQPRHFSPLPSMVNPLAAAAVAEVANTDVVSVELAGAVFIDTFETMAVDGVYVRRLGPDHDNRTIRTVDGIHYTYYGGLVLTEPILAEIERRSG